MAIDRKINVEKMSEEQLEKAISSISGKIKTDLEELVKNSNAMLNRYGLACKMNIMIDTEDKITKVK